MRRRAGLHRTKGFLVRGLPTTKNERDTRYNNNNSRAKPTPRPNKRDLYSFEPFVVSNDLMINMGFISIEERAGPIFRDFTDPINEIFFEHEDVPKMFANMSCCKPRCTGMKDHRATELCYLLVLV